MKVCSKFILFLVVLGTAALSACHHNAPMITDASDKRPFTPYQANLVARIKTGGGVVVKQGSTIEILLSTDKFFRTGTTNLRNRKLDTLNEVASLLKSQMASHPKYRIDVIGHTDTIFSRAHRKPLSKQYAEEVAAYLWHRGIPQKRVNVLGVGSSSPIASNKTPKGSAYNRRVVIKLS